MVSAAGRGVVIRVSPARLLQTGLFRGSIAQPTDSHVFRRSVESIAESCSVFLIIGQNSFGPKRLLTMRYRLARSPFVMA